MTDSFTIKVFENNTRYGMDMCKELEAAVLSDNEAYTVFEGLSSGQHRSSIDVISHF